MAAWLANKVENVLQLGQSVKPNPEVLPELQFRQANQRQHAGKVIAMLVGETGHGKSQLANFLVDEETCLETTDKPTGRRLPFKASASSNACTQSIKSAECTFNNKQFCLVDTPGYGESKETKDLEHVLQVAEYLKQHKEVSAIVFCFRFGRFEAVGEQIVRFLRDLFGQGMLKSNLILVVTNVENGRAAQKERQTNQQTLEGIIDEVRTKVQKAFGLEQGLVAIDIDTMPEGEEAEKYAKGRRAQILRAIEGLPVISVSDLSIPKHPSLKQQDAKEIRSLELKKQEVVASMQAQTQEERQIVEQLKEDQQQATNLTSRMSKIKEKLLAVDTDTEVKTAYEEGRRGGWNVFHQDPLKIVAESEFPVSSHIAQVRDSDDRVFPEQLSPYSWEISVKPYYGRLGSCEASLTLYSKTRDVEAKFVKDLQEQLDNVDSDNAMLKQRISKLSESKNVRSNFVDKAQKELDVITARIAFLQKERMTIEEAESRLKEMLAA